MHKLVIAGAVLAALVVVDRSAKVRTGVAPASSSNAATRRAPAPCGCQQR